MTTASVLHTKIDTDLPTNVTKDNTAADLRGVLHQMVDDMLAAGLTPAQISTIAGAVSRAMVSKDTSLTNVRFAQTVIGIAPASSTLGIQPTGLIPYGGGITKDKMLSGGGTIDVVGAVITDYMPVTPSGTLTTAAMGNSSTGVAFYDANKTYISITNGPFTDGQVLTVPASAVFARATVWYDTNNTNIHKAQLLEGSRSPIPHVWQTMPSYVAMHRPWTNRVWSTHGDSMAANRTGNAWFSQAAQYHGCRYVKNESIDGGNSQTLMGKYNALGSAQVPMTADFFADVDCCFVIVGTNDAAIARPIGAITDDPATGTTFYAYYRKFIEFALTANPYMRMVLATPLYSGSAGKTNAIMNSFMDAVRALCAKYALKLWDIGHESQFSDFTYAYYSDDMLHPRYHIGNPDPLIAPYVSKDLGSSLIYGSQLRGFMHTVMPIDYQGDPEYRELLTTYTRPFI